MQKRKSGRGGQSEREATAQRSRRHPEAGGAPSLKPRNRPSRDPDRGPPKRSQVAPVVAVPETPAPKPSLYRGPARPAGGPSEPMRIAKAMARAGLCSRRDAERWILDGRVSVNGEVLTSPARDVGPRDRIEVDETPLPAAEPARLWRYHKPKGCVTTHRDPEGRPTVFDRLPPGLPRVISIGRLDFNTEGLLLLTNDGALARHLELPSTGWMRRYRVRAFGSVTAEQLDALKDGLEVDGVRYGPIEASLDQVQGSNVWLTLGLREGKNREVRNILASLQLAVNRLIRVSFGPFQLLDLEEEAAESVKRRVLADQLGPELTEKFGLAAEDPPPAPPPQRSFGKPRDDGARSRPNAAMRAPSEASERPKRGFAGPKTPSGDRPRPPFRSKLAQADKGGPKFGAPQFGNRKTRPKKDA